VIKSDPNEPLHNRCRSFLGLRTITADSLQGPEAAASRPAPTVPAEQMIVWKVDRMVGNVRNDTPDCIEPMSDSQDDTPSLFA
jgi:putative SOS response-associated peptidase YedK